MGWAERVKRKRSCRGMCLLKLERTARELVDHSVQAHPLKEPQPFEMRPVFTAKDKRAILPAALLRRLPRLHGAK